MHQIKLIAFVIVVVLLSSGLGATAAHSQTVLTSTKTHAATAMPSRMPSSTPTGAGRSNQVQLRITRADFTWLCINPQGPIPKGPHDPMPWCAGGVEASGALEGRLTDAHGNGIGGRQIILLTYPQNYKQWYQFAQVMTGSTGYFRFVGPIDFIGRGISVSPGEGDLAGALFRGDSTYPSVGASPVPWKVTIMFSK
jgi:hypothetical protein